MNNDFENLLREFRDPEERSWILMSPSSIGETTTLCSFLPEFQKHHNLPITLVIPHTQKVVPEFFSTKAKRIIYSDVMTMRSLADYAGIPRGAFLPDIPISTWIGSEGQFGLGRLYNLWIESKGTMGLDFPNSYRQKLRLHWSSPMAKPILPEGKLARGHAVLSECGSEGRFAIIHSGNNTNAPIDSSLIEQICIALDRAGYSIIINEGGATFSTKRVDFPYVRYVKLNLEDAISVSLCASMIISGANGMAHLLSGIPHGIPQHVFPPRFTLDGHDSSASGLHFRAVVNPFEGSTFLGSFEWVKGHKNYHEWFVPDPAESGVIELIANAIAENRKISEYCLSPETELISSQEPGCPDLEIPAVGGTSEVAGEQRW